LMILLKMLMSVKVMLNLMLKKIKANVAWYNR
jgi:hypothetical protein